MADSSLRLIASFFCKPYSTEATAYIDDAHPSGRRHLVVQYDEGQPEFISAIPFVWSDNDVLDLLLWPDEGLRRRSVSVHAVAVADYG